MQRLALHAAMIMYITSHACTPARTLRWPDHPRVAPCISYHNTILLCESHELIYNPRWSSRELVVDQVKSAIQQV